MDLRAASDIQCCTVSVPGMTFKCVFSFKGESVCCKYVRESLSRVHNGWFVFALVVHTL